MTITPPKLDAGSADPNALRQHIREVAERVGLLATAFNTTVGSTSLTSLTFGSRSEAATAAAGGQIDATTQALICTGYATPGDVSTVQFYVRVTNATLVAYGLSTTSKAILAFQDASTDWWLLATDSVTPRQLGHNGGVASGTPTAGTGYTWRQVAAAVNEYATLVIKSPVTLLFEERYLFGDGEPIGPAASVRWHAVPWGGGVIGGASVTDICPAIIVDTAISGSDRRFIKISSPRSEIRLPAIIHLCLMGSTPTDYTSLRTRVDQFKGIGLLIGKGTTVPSAVTGMPSGPAAVLNLSGLQTAINADTGIGTNDVADTSVIEVAALLGFYWGMVVDQASKADIHVTQMDSIWPAVECNIGAKSVIGGYTAKGWTTGNTNGGQQSIAITGVARSADGYLEVTLTHRHCYGKVGTTGKAGLSGVSVNGVSVNQSNGTDATITASNKLKFTTIPVALTDTLTTSSPAVSVRPGGTKRRVPIKTVRAYTIGAGPSQGVEIETEFPHGIDASLSFRSRYVGIAAPNDTPDTTDIGFGRYQIISGSTCAYLVQANTYADVQSSTVIRLLQEDGTPLPWQVGTNVTGADLYMVASLRAGGRLVYNVDASYLKETFLWSCQAGTFYATGGTLNFGTGHGGEGDQVDETRTGIRVLNGSNNNRFIGAELTSPGDYAVYVDASTGDVTLVNDYWIVNAFNYTFNVQSGGLMVGTSTIQSRSTMADCWVYLNSSGRGLFLASDFVQGNLKIVGDTTAAQQEIAGYVWKLDGNSYHVAGQQYDLYHVTPGATPSTPATLTSLFGKDVNGYLYANVPLTVARYSVGSLPATVKRGAIAIAQGTPDTLAIASADGGTWRSAAMHMDTAQQAGVLMAAGTTGQRGTTANTVRRNTTTARWEGTSDGTNWYAFHDDSLFSVTRLIVQTTDATPTKLTTDGGAATNSNTIRNVTDYTGAQYRVMVTARNPSTGDYASWSYDIDFLRKNNLASTTVLGGGATLAPTRSSGALSACRLDLTADTTNGRLDVIGTGIAATTIAWAATLLGHSS